MMAICESGQCNFPIPQSQILKAMSPTSLFPSSKPLPTAVAPAIRARSQPRLSTPPSKRAILSGGCSPVSSNLPGVVKCSSEEKASSTPKAKDLLAELVDERVGELLSREENRGLFDGLEKATQRVEIARKELLEIEKQEEEAKATREYVRKLASRQAEIAECGKELSAARAMVEEAEDSLSANMGQSNFGEALGNIVEGEVIDKDIERFESVKAAVVAATVGTLASLPLSFTETSDEVQLTLHSAAIFISCALFGVTFRYAIRRDLDNVQLKTGTSAAFGFVKGLAEMVAVYPLELKNESFLSTAIKGAVYMSQSLLIFFFAAVGLDYCFKVGLLSPFPIRKGVSQ